MSENQHSTQQYSRARRLALAATFGLVATLGPLTVTPAAEAAVTSNGCTVTQQRPNFLRHNSQGKKVVSYPVKVFCKKGREIDIYMRIWEDDPNNLWNDGDDRIRPDISLRRKFVRDEQVLLSGEGVLPNTEDGNEEMFYDFRFRVRTPGEDWFPWSKRESSPVLNIPN